MVMDARWKVYVQDRRFDDNQISNMYLKLKWETVGRFSFDFRPIDGDESYMVPNNTLRIFWGDLHKLDGVIQRVDWDSTQWCYHIYGADIRGLLLERVNTEPATVHSYTSDIQTSVMFQGCDFPTNVWTGSGENIGKYTFRYHIGIQNTIRITSPTVRWETFIERGTVYEHQNGCLYDATKNWETNTLRGATLRFVSGACKNNVYNINGNTANRVCIRLPGEPATLYQGNNPECARYIQVGTQWYYNKIENGGFENATSTTWATYTSNYVQTIDMLSTATPHSGSMCMYASARGTGGYTDWAMITASNHGVSDGDTLSFWYRVDRCYYTYPYQQNQSSIKVESAAVGNTEHLRIDLPNGFATGWTYVECVMSAVRTNLHIGCVTRGAGVYLDVAFDDIQVLTAVASGPNNCAFGTIPGCSRIGDIYEIVSPRMIQTQPPSLSPATLEQDNHIIQYNLVDDQSDHTTVMTVRGTGE